MINLLTKTTFKTVTNFFPRCHNDPRHESSSRCLKQCYCCYKTQSLWFPPTSQQTTGHAHNYFSLLSTPITTEETELRPGALNSITVVALHSPSFNALQHHNNWPLHMQYVDLSAPKRLKIGLLNARGECVGRATNACVRAVVRRKRRHAP